MASPSRPPLICLRVLLSSKQWWLHIHLSFRQLGPTLYLFLTCGDFNCHLANWLGVGTFFISNGTSAQGFCDSMELIQPVNFPTWISPNSKYSLLKLVMTNLPTNFSCSFSAPIVSSDYVLVRVNISLANLKELPRHHWVLQFTQADGRVCKQPSHFRTSLLGSLPLILSTFSSAQMHPISSLKTYLKFSVQCNVIPCSPNYLLMASKANTILGLLTSSAIIANNRILSFPLSVKAGEP